MTQIKGPGKTDFFMYFNGEYVLSSQPIFTLSETAHMWGYAVSDTIRTFNKKPHLASDHILRLLDSCSAAQIDVKFSHDDIYKILLNTVKKNSSIAKKDEDFLIVIYVIGNWNLYPSSPGLYSPSSLIIHCSSIDFKNQSKLFSEGQKVRISNIQQIPSNSISPNIKHRSRMHFVLADKEVKSIEENALPLLLDCSGNITETIHANFFMVKDNIIQTPTDKNILPGITRRELIFLAKHLDLQLQEKNLTPADVLASDEAFFTSSSRIITPISHINGTQIGTSIPGPIAQNLLEEYSKIVGLDISNQFLKQSHSEHN